MKRYIKYLPLALLFLACTKEPAPDNGGGASSYDEHHWDWGDSIKRHYNGRELLWRSEGDNTANQVHADDECHQ